MSQNKNNISDLLKESRSLGMVLFIENDQGVQKQVEIVLHHKELDALKVKDYQEHHEPYGNWMSESYGKLYKISSLVDENHMPTQFASYGGVGGLTQDPIPDGFGVKSAWAKNDTGKLYQLDGDAELQKFAASFNQIRDERIELTKPKPVTPEQVISDVVKNSGHLLLMLGVENEQGDSQLINVLLSQQELNALKERDRTLYNPTLKGSDYAWSNPLDEQIAKEQNYFEIYGGVGALSTTPVPDGFTLKSATLISDKKQINVEVDSHLMQLVDSIQGGRSKDSEEVEWGRIQGDYEKAQRKSIASFLSKAETLQAVITYQDPDSNKALVSKVAFSADELDILKLENYFDNYDQKGTMLDKLYPALYSPSAVVNQDNDFFGGIETTVSQALTNDILPKNAKMMRISLSKGMGVDEYLYVEAGPAGNDLLSSFVNTRDHVRQAQVQNQKATDLDDLLISMGVSAYVKEGEPSVVIGGLDKGQSAHHLSIDHSEQLQGMDPQSHSPFKRANGAPLNSHQKAAVMVTPFIPSINNEQAANLLKAMYIENQMITKPIEQGSQLNEVQKTVFNAVSDFLRRVDGSNPPISTAIHLHGSRSHELLAGALDAYLENFEQTKNHTHLSSMTY